MQKVVLTDEGWSGLVSRLNESGKRKTLGLLQAKQRALAEQMASATFQPQISERSREIAAANRALPDRVAALMKAKKARLDKIRLEREQKELEEATFRPAINARTGGGASGEDALGADERRLGHLMQYEVDRRIRAEQRKLLLGEMEERALTFAPALNKNSMRIVERLKASLASDPGAAAERAGGAGRSRPAGHEGETFQPRINARSRALQGAARAGDVVSRLYKAPAPRDDGAAGAGAGGEADERSAPSYFNMVAYDAAHGRHDFILRRLLSAAGAAAAYL